MASKRQKSMFSAECSLQEELGWTRREETRGMRMRVESSHVPVWVANPVICAQPPPTPYIQPDILCIIYKVPATRVAHPHIH
jgi:hypothetical protein